MRYETHTVKVPRDLRWLVVKATVRSTVALLWTTRDLNLLRWAKGLRSAIRLRRNLREALDRSLVLGEVDR